MHPASITPSDRGEGKPSPPFFLIFYTLFLIFLQEIWEIFGEKFVALSRPRMKSLCDSQDSAEFSY
ncbi:MAG: hypothetical protein MJE68_31140 [Proteobacteria bacterium]|nr:hypothetical protein [Pseudomonadota bacterium]